MSVLEVGKKKKEHDQHYEKEINKAEIAYLTAKL